MNSYLEIIAKLNQIDTEIQSIKSVISILHNEWIPRLKFIDLCGIGPSLYNQWKNDGKLQRNLHNNKTEEGIPPPFLRLLIIFCQMDFKEQLLSSFLKCQIPQTGTIQKGMLLKTGR